IAAEAVGFEKRSAATHERIGDAYPFERIRLEESFAERYPAELRKEQRAKKSAGTASEPFVNGNNWPIFLLDLFFAQSQAAHEGNVEVMLDAQRGAPVR